MPRDDGTGAMNPNQINKFPYLKPNQFPGAYVRPLKKHKNMEYRARAGKHHGTLNFGKDLEKALFAYGNPTHPDIVDPHLDSQNYLTRLPTAGGTVNQLQQRPPHPFHSQSSEHGNAAPFPETLRVLDEIVTDFIIEVCHEAVDHATFEGRHKVNPQDISFVFRNDRAMLGRMRAMANKSKSMKESRKGVAERENVNSKMTVEELMELGQAVGEEGTGKGKGRGRGRRKRKVRDADGGGEDAPSPAGGVSEGGEGDGDDGAGGTEPSTKRARSEAA